MTSTRGMVTSSGRVQSQRIAAVQSPVIPIVGELIRSHPGTISLGQGVVSYGPPPQSLERIQDFSTDENNHKYQAVQGIPLLLDAIEKKLAEENQIDVDASRQVVVTAGSNMAFNNALLAIADPGDEIILAAPFYFNHEMAIAMANCRAVIVPTGPQQELDPGALAAAITPRTKAIVTISPNNPSGAVYSAECLREVNQICQASGIYHISDEAYEYFTYDETEHFSPGSISGSSDYTISLFSLSKAYGFASWRIGYMVIPPHLLEPVKKIQDTILICPPVISQYGALGALEAGSNYWQPKIKALAAVRQQVINALDDLGDAASFTRAKGAFYFLVKLNRETTPMTAIEYLVKHHRVAAIPGTAFGLHDGTYLRIAYAALPADSVQEGIGRFVTGVRAFVSSNSH